MVKNNIFGDYMFNTTIPIELIYALLPIVLLELALTIFALYDWFKQGAGLENRYIWLLVILLLNLIGPLLYFWKAPRDSLDI